MEICVKVFKALGEPTRLKILRLLSVRPMYVCELESVLGMSQPRISQHLRVMKEAGILRESREAQKTFYRLDWDVVESVITGFLEFLKTDIKTLPDFKEECSRIEKLDCDSRVISCKMGK